MIDENKVAEILVDEIINRKDVNIDKENIKKEIRNKVVLITGGGGSIGFELCKQIIAYEPKQIIIFDIYENNAYMAYQKLLFYKSKTKIIVIIGSVYDKTSIRQVFIKNKIDIVFHAAAYKHVPLMEDVPLEAIKTNCVGTYNVAECCNDYNVKKMVLISTDKAINPINVMGASKKIAEQIVLQFSLISINTKFSIVRFGNVFNSNGSLIPILINQIQKIKSITITHPNATRYFMSISDAISLILHSLILDSKNKIFMLDMGKQKNILEVAIQLIEKLDLIPYKDVNIEFIGLRKGERLCEEEINYNELERTNNKYIFSLNNINDSSLIEIDKFLKEIFLSTNLRKDILEFANKKREI